MPPKQPRFRINLKDAHLQSGLTPYAVAKQLGLNQNTVRKYLSEVVETEGLLNHVIQIAEFFNLDWRDPGIIEVIEGDEFEDEIENPLAVPA